MLMKGRIFLIHTIIFFQRFWGFGFVFETNKQQQQKHQHIQFY